MTIGDIWFQLTEHILNLIFCQLLSPGPCDQRRKTATIVIRKLSGTTASAAATAPAQPELLHTPEEAEQRQQDSARFVAGGGGCRPVLRGNLA